MYKIKLYFQSNIPGVYTLEEETANDLMHMKFKKERMLDRWFNIICPHINFDTFCNKLNWLVGKNPSEINDIKYSLKFDLINLTLDQMNQYDAKYLDDKTELTKRTFKIDVVMF